MANKRMASPPPAMPTERVYGDTDPDVEKYSKGGPEEFGEGKRVGPYVNSQPPAMPTEDGGHPGTLRAVLAKKAKKCLKIASAYLGAGAPEAAVEDAALSMMDWSDRQVNAAYAKAASDEECDDDDGEMGKESGKPWEEDEGEEVSKTASRLYDHSRMVVATAPYIKDEDEDEGEDDVRQARIASILGTEKEACDTMPKMAEAESEVKADEGEEDNQEVTALKKCLAYLSNMPADRRLKKIAAFGKILKMADANVAGLFSSERLVPANTPQADKINEHSQLLNMVESGGLGNGMAQSSSPMEVGGEDLMGGVSDLTDEESDLAKAVDSESADFLPQSGGEEEDEDEEMGGSDDDELNVEFGDDDEGEEVEEDEEEVEEPLPPKTARMARTASSVPQRPQPKKMSKTASPKRLGTVTAATKDQMKSLSSLWKSAPDLSEYFGVSPTDLTIKDYE